MIVRYKGKKSSTKKLPGGGPQGALLGLLLFLVLVNDVGFENQSNQNGEIITCKKRFKQFNELHLKYVDDSTICFFGQMFKEQINGCTHRGQSFKFSFQEKEEEMPHILGNPFDFWYSYYRVCLPCVTPVQ